MGRGLGKVMRISSGTTLCPVARTNFANVSVRRYQSIGLYREFSNTRLEGMANDL